ncbi:hypothetical protein [Fodinibius sp. Rm-B-1B1-1]|uniref:hypothetical protein n=1 Tax=Fodinibius alkaliphilus TaxID=3140241 RepID=UPI00315A8631
MNLRPPFRLLFASIVIVFLSVGCHSGDKSPDKSPTWNTVQDSTDRVLTIQGGLKGPESVQYDSEQDLFFISNFNGDAAADSNGFISRAQPDGTIDSLKFITGTTAHPLHGPRGMTIKGDTLFVADQKGIHGFNRHSGTHISFIDFTDFEPGFLNDIALGPQGQLYVTDSRKPQLYQISGKTVSIAVDSLSHVNNGIMLDEANQRLVMAAWEDGKTFLTWQPSSNTLDSAGTGLGGNYDGIEPISKNSFIVTSQADSTLQLIKNGSGQIFVNVPGKPADIGVDTKRNRVAVPYIALNRVDIWQLPNQE